MVTPMLVRRFFRRTDRTVDRIGYWYGLYDLLAKSWTWIVASLLTWGGVMSWYFWEAQRLLVQIANEVGRPVYGVLVFLGLSSLFGVAMCVVLIARRIRGKTWDGIERDERKRAYAGLTLTPPDPFKMADLFAEYAKELDGFGRAWMAEEEACRARWRCELHSGNWDEVRKQEGKELAEIGRRNIERLAERSLLYNVRSAYYTASRVAFIEPYLVRGSYALERASRADDLLEISAGLLKISAALRAPSFAFPTVEEIQEARHREAIATDRMKTALKELNDLRQSRQDIEGETPP